MSQTTPLAQAIAGVRPGLVSVAIISVFVNLTLLVPPLYMLQVYDRVLAAGHVGTLLMLSLIALIMLSVFGILEYARQGILIRLGRRFDAILSGAIFSTLAVHAAHDTSSHGLAAMRDAATLRETIGSSTPASLFDVPWTPVFIALCWLMHPLLGMVSLFAAIGIFTIALFTETLSRGGIAEANIHAQKSARVSAMSFANVETVRALGMQKAMSQKWQESHFNSVDSLSIASERVALMLALSKFTRLGVQSALLGTGAWLVIQNEISPGIMIAASIIMGRALAPIEQLVGNWRRIVAARAAYKRLTDLFRDLPDEPKKTSLPAISGRIELEAVEIVPPGVQKPAVQNASCVIEAGSIVAIVGASGSGKTCLARAIAGIWPCAEGAIRFDGASLDQWSSEDLGRLIGYVPQSVALFDGTVAENVARFTSASDESIVEAARRAGVHEAILRLPQGYETRIGEGGLALSGGMAQRVALARAMFGKPSIVILDEPNANLDTEGDRALSAAIAGLKADGCTVLIVTHKPQILGKVDFVMVVHDGRIKQFAPRDEILRPQAPRPIEPARATSTAA